MIIPVRGGRNLFVVAAGQVQKRALEVWGSAEAIEDEKIRRKHKLASNKAKKVERNIENKRKKVSAFNILQVLLCFIRDVQRPSI